MAYVLAYEEDWSGYGTSISAVSNNVEPDSGRYVYVDLIGSNLAAHGTTCRPHRWDRTVALVCKTSP
jgi:hypothetical protein